MTPSCTVIWHARFTIFGHGAAELGQLSRKLQGGSKDTRLAPAVQWVQLSCNYRTGLGYLVAVGRAPDYVLLAEDLSRTSTSAWDALGRAQCLYRAEVQMRPQGTAYQHPQKGAGQSRLRQPLGPLPGPPYVSLAHAHLHMPPQEAWLGH